MGMIDESAVFRVAEVVEILEKNLDFITPTYLDQGPETVFYDLISEKVSLLYKLILKNRWLFRPILRQILVGKASTQSTIRSSMQFTLLRSGIKENILPLDADLNINFRVHPLDDPQSLYQKVDRILQKLDFYEDLQMRMGETVLEQHAEYGGAGRCHFDLNSHLPLNLLNKNLQKLYNSNLAVNYEKNSQVRGKIVSLPSLCPGGTDSRKFQLHTKQSIRFNMMDLINQDLSRIHGNDERVSVESYRKALEFYLDVLVDTAGGKSIFASSVN